MSIRVDIIYATAQRTQCPDEAALEKWVSTALTPSHKTAQVTLKLVDEPEMLLLNHTYRGRKKTTNVLSFPCTLPPTLRQHQLGDIALCVPVIQQEATAQQKELQAHWAHLVIHGILHLLGYDHENEEDAALMEQQETQLMTDLHFPDPYEVEKTHVS